KLICERDYPAPTQVRANYPPALERIVMKALAKRREDRYQSAREMQQDLESFVREERIPVSQVTMSRWMSGLFEDKLAQQKEALQDIKQLADVIAAQAAKETEGTHGGTTTPSLVHATTATQAPPRRNGSASVWIAVAGLAGLGVLGFLYLKRQTD